MSTLPEGPYQEYFGKEHNPFRKAIRKYYILDCKTISCD